jgi:hypothetical protein
VLGLGQSIEGDEAVVLYWGRQWWLKNEWHLITQTDVPTWESFTAYLFGGFDLASINPRWISLTLSLFEVGFLFLWVQTVHSRKLAILSSLSMLSFPYHAFLGLSLGPLNAGFLTALYLWLDSLPNSPVRRFIVTLVGLGYYAAFRVLLLWKGIKHLVKKEVKPLLPEILGTLVFLAGLFFFLYEEFFYFFNKGAYLVERGPQYFLFMYFQSFMVWFVPFFNSIFSFLKIYQFDDLGRAFMQHQTFDTPFGLPLSLLFLLGVWSVRHQPRYYSYLGLLLLSYLLMGWTATLVHFAFLVPIFAFFVAFGFLELERLLSIRQLFYTRVSVALWVLISMGNFTFQFYFPKPENLLQEFVAHPVYEVKNQKLNLNEVLFVAADQPIFLRYYADKEKLNWSFFYENPHTWILETRGRIQNGKTRYLVVIEPFDSKSENPEIKKMFENSIRLNEQYRALLRANFVIKSERSLFLKNHLKVATLYEIDPQAQF